jgi:hypothetical protein
MRGLETSFDIYISTYLIVFLKDEFSDQSAIPSVNILSYASFHVSNMNVSIWMKIIPHRPVIAKMR